MLHVEQVAKLLPAVALISAVALLSACSPNPSDSDAATRDPADAGVAGSGGEQSGQALLAETLAMGPQVRDVIGRLTEACLRDAGLDRFPSQAPAAESTLLTVVVPPVSPALDEARTDGYGGGADASESESDDTGSAEFTWASAADERRFQEILTGAADGETLTDSAGQPTLGGCIGQARTAVYGEVAAPQNPATVIGETAQAAYDSDPSVTAAASAWSQCLREKDYPQLLDPADAQRYAQYFYHPVGGRPGGPVPAGGPWPADVAKEMEIELAVADAECADQAGLRDAQQQAWDAALDAAVDQHEAQLFGYRDAMAAALQRGQQALGN
ncbi:hypothetical protein [Micromonospora sp. NBC_01813]|uniref:hypothetical protein n=1 Tax=Micromonospora sp. NBC_01813 TaxID=2975988 RepID=UPI002DD7D8BB|nr:hypothetical protein [Micromonospora sp. NBC_01813]WSA08541.1 hypothetical protein OG958_30900 [Micromonospora sp. NBC_01813]